MVFKVLFKVTSVIIHKCTVMCAETLFFCNNSIDIYQSLFMPRATLTSMVATKEADDTIPALKLLAFLLGRKMNMDELGRK